MLYPEVLSRGFVSKCVDYMEANIIFLFDVTFEFGRNKSGIHDNNMNVWLFCFNITENIPL